MKFKLQAGREVDVLTQDELKHHLDQQTVSWFQEMARGMSTARFASTATPDGSSAVQFPAPGEPVIGPDIGFAWAVQRIDVFPLDPADTLQVYRNAPLPWNYLGPLTQGHGLKPGSKGIILRGDERLVIVGTSLTTADSISVNGEVLEVGESDLYKVM